MIVPSIDYIKIEQRHQANAYKPLYVLVLVWAILADAVLIWIALS